MQTICISVLVLYPFSFFTSSSSLKRQELPTAADHKWLMRLRKENDKKNPGSNSLPGEGETNEDCPGTIEEEWEGNGNHFGNAGLDSVDNDVRLLKTDQYQWPAARKRGKSYLTRTGKRSAANWTTGDERGTFYVSRAGKRGIFYLTRAGKRAISYLTRAGKRATPNPRRAQR